MGIVPFNNVGDSQIGKVTKKEAARSVNSGRPISRSNRVGCGDVVR